MDKKKPDSPALAFVRHLFRHSLEANGHSWTRLNGCMYQAVKIAIEAGLVFEEDDIKRMRGELSGGYWFHDGGTEHWYADAIKFNNRSAWKSLEKYHDRPPFLMAGDRVAVGHRFTWKDDKDEFAGMVDVTSFNDKGQMVAVLKEYDTDERGYRTKTRIVRTYRITRDELRAAYPPKKKAKKETQETEL